ncbi:DUF3854 domain-containing protein [Pontibacillus yanchengensis]|uniref:DUF3854 domain-containing protein n=2 Tax=Pontibacillus yanchengensis TaxID=462910 RepID=A0ACC7VMH8_9BACI|nr:DUF3854 domain-containing protein [Pontibacillus yanchengensis]MYL35460.1 DUF3854 domain-containing protein [Pontibacillus yanchengensis]MYL55660.1 DUF3854 domain-containing protein [Pontibacillus yanchengensis]
MGLVTEETIEKARNVDLLFLAQQMDEPLQRVGGNYFTYRNGGERTPSLSISPQKGMWKDFSGTDGGYSGISFYAYRHYNTSTPKGRDFIESVKAICKLCGITIEYKNGKQEENNHVEYKARKEINQVATKASVDQLHTFYQEWLRLNSCSPSHKEHLKEVRNINPSVAKVRFYRSLDAEQKERYKLVKEMKKNLGEPSGVPGFVLKKGKYGPYWTAYGKAGLMIPFRDIHNQIQGMQIMYDERPQLVQSSGELQVQMKDWSNFIVINSSTGEKVGEYHRNQLPLEFENGNVFIELGPKYGWFSKAPNEEHGILDGAEIGNPIPYHCAVPAKALLNWTVHKGTVHDYQHHVDSETVWWGEGPLKGDIASEYTKQIHLQVPGVNQWRLLLEPTKELMPKRVIFSFDADAQTKEETVQVNVLNAIEEAKQELQPLGIELAIALWPAEKGKGLDDLMNAGYRPKIVSIP